MARTRRYGCFANAALGRCVAGTSYGDIRTSVDGAPIASRPAPHDFAS